MADMPDISANQLRALAERADSYRGRTVFLVRNAPGAVESYDVAGADDLDDREVVMVLRTPDAEPAFRERAFPFVLSSAPEVHLRTLRNKGLNDCDAIFTSLVAVEKFVVPYYTRFRSPEQVRAMRDSFATFTGAAAICHVPDSREDELIRSSLHVLVPSERKDGPLHSVTLDDFTNGAR